MGGKGWLVVIAVVIGGMLLLCGAGAVVGAVVGISVAQAPAAPAPSTGAETTVAASCTGIIVSGSCNTDVTQTQQPAPVSGQRPGEEAAKVFCLLVIGAIGGIVLAISVWGSGEF